VAGSTHKIQDFDHYWLVVDYKVDNYLILRLSEETKRLQVGYHRMGRSGRG
jgi:hypothetical protein